MEQLSSHGWLSSAHRCLTTDEILLSQFGQRRAAAQRKYREFVVQGARNPSIWEDLQGQSLLGVEGWAESLLGHVRGQEKIREIPKGQRHLGRPSLGKLFRQSDRQGSNRNKAIEEAVTKHGYSQVELAGFLGLHYSSISRICQASDGE